MRYDSNYQGGNKKMFIEKQEIVAAEKGSIQKMKNTSRIIWMNWVDGWMEIK